MQPPIQVNAVVVETCDDFPQTSGSDAHINLSINANSEQVSEQSLLLACENALADVRIQCLQKKFSFDVRGLSITKFASNVACSFRYRKLSMSF